MYWEQTYLPDVLGTDVFCLWYHFLGNRRVPANGSADLTCDVTHVRKLTSGSKKKETTLETQRKLSKIKNMIAEDIK